MKKEIRLYGLDAPEVKVNRKMIEDGEKQFTCPIIAPIWFAILHFVLSVAPPKTALTIITEQDNYYATGTGNWDM